MAAPRAPGVRDLLEGIVYYRGSTHGDRRRIRTGRKDWDSYLFVTERREDAAMYGGDIWRVELRDDARILREGTREFVAVAGRWRKGESLLDYADRAARQARAAGYDAIHFGMQSSVGTAILNRKAVRTRRHVPGGPGGLDGFRPAPRVRDLLAGLLVLGGAGLLLGALRPSR